LDDNDISRPSRPTRSPSPRSELAKARGLVGARIAYKMNAVGEHVVALIFPSQPR
jgi:hypothetical protein